MDIQPQTNPHILTLPSKPLLTQPSQTPHQQYYTLSTNSIALVDLQKQQIIHTIAQAHESRIGCIRSKNNLLVTGGYDNLMSVFDARTFQLVHSFRRVPAKFMAVDISEYILAGAASSNVVFWDLRKMKQRSEFKDSFNDDITYLRFQDQITTNLLACSVDGMINMFDLTQPNEEDAFSWCYKVLQSPEILSVSTHGRLLARTSDHHLYKIQQGDLTGKISPNNTQNPKHIVYSHFQPNHNYNRYGYFTWSPQQKVVEHWVGNFMDKSNQEKCMGYLSDVDDLELFSVITANQGAYVGVYVDQKGAVCAQRFSSQRKVRHPPTHDSEPTNDNKKWNFNRKENASKSQQKSNRNGYVLEKPASSFANHKKFKPY